MLAILAGVVLSSRAGFPIIRQLRTLPLAAPEGAPSPIKEISQVQERLKEDFRKLQESEARHRELFDANPHAMWVYDLETLAFLAVNDAAINRYGYSREEFLAMTIKDIRPPEDLDRLLANVAKVSEGLNDTGSIWRHQTRAGRILDVEITSHFLLFKGRRAELILANDITEQLRAKRALEEHARQQLLAARLGRLALSAASIDEVIDNASEAI
ncbi:MAG: PAS domain S-box protein, partial [Marinobacter sp.]|nr:PAS domain S-box protein [Marinobacter sp.]